MKKPLGTQVEKQKLLVFYISKLMKSDKFSYYYYTLYGTENSLLTVFTRLSVKYQIGMSSRPPFSN